MSVSLYRILNNNDLVKIKSLLFFQLNLTVLTDLFYLTTLVSQIMPVNLPII